MEYAECSHPFPFFGMHGKTGEIQVNSTNVTTTTLSSINTSDVLLNATTNAPLIPEKRSLKNENLSAIVPRHKDSLYQQRLCNGQRLIKKVIM